MTGFGDKLVSAKPPFGGDKVDYQIAIVQVSDPVLGARDAKEIKVGFIPPPPPDPPPPPNGPFIIRKRYPQFTLTLDQEACPFLVKHPTEDFYVGLNYYDILNKNAGDFDKGLDEVKRCVKLLADPMTALKGKNADDRFLTAALLIGRYRTPRPGETKTEPIDAEQSKLILQALADADWNAKPAPAPGFNGFQRDAVNRVLPPRRDAAGRLDAAQGRQGGSGLGPAVAQGQRREVPHPALRGGEKR